jgi:hypothetical protein
MRILANTSLPTVACARSQSGAISPETIGKERPQREDSSTYQLDMSPCEFSDHTRKGALPDVESLAREERLKLEEVNVRDCLEYARRHLSL